MEFEKLLICKILRGYKYNCADLISQEIVQVFSHEGRVAMRFIIRHHFTGQNYRFSGYRSN